MKFDNLSTSKLHTLSSALTAPWLYIFLSAVFLMISYSSNHYWDEFYYLYSIHTFSLSELLQMEPDLGKGMFPQGFFSVKIGFVVFLYILDFFFPGGEISLHAIQLIFAVIVLLHTYVAYLLLKELFDKEAALLSTITLLFLPLSIYFSYKVLSEVFSLLLITAGCWSYIRSFSVTGKNKLAAYLGCTVLFLLLGILFRFTTIIMFGGMLVALFLVGDKRFPRMKLVLTSVIVVLATVTLTLFCYKYVVGLSISEIMALLGAVTVRSHGIAIKIYSTFMIMQFFALILLFCTRQLLSKATLFAAIWVLVTSLPFIFLSDYVEPRYFYMASLPLAVLCAIGMIEISRFFSKKGQRSILTYFFIVLALVVTGNRLIFADLMTYELNQKNYHKLLQSIESKEEDVNYVVPWISDFCLLKYRYPEKNIYLSWSMPHGEAHPFFEEPAYVKWAGGDDYINSPKRLLSLESPVYYIGWRYNQPAVKIKRRMMWLKNRYVDDIEASEGLKNHLAQSWIWKSPDFSLEPALTYDPYESFLVQIGENEGKNEGKNSGK